MKMLNHFKVDNKYTLIIKRTFKTMNKQGVAGLPAQISFYFLWSLIPMVIAVSVITGFFDFANEQIIAVLSNASVDEFTDIILPYFVDNKGDSFNLLVLIPPIYIGSKSFNSLIGVTEVMYGTTTRNIFAKRFYAAVLLFAFIFLLVFLIFIPTFGAKILSYIFALLNVDEAFLKVFVVLRWPLSLIVIYVGILSIYIGTLKFRIPARKLVYGALVTTLGWAITSVLFEVYLTNIADFSIYGSFANIVVLFFWFFILSYVFVLGVAVNIAFDKDIEIP